MEIKKLNNGEYIGIEIIEITGIPSTLNNKNINEEDYMNRFKNILSEFYQIYKTNYGIDISLEYLLISEGVKYQTYNAKIRLYLIIRTLFKTENGVKIINKNILNNIQSSLSILDYTFKNIELNELDILLKQVNHSSINILKEGKVVNLHNTLLPNWFVFHPFNQNNMDLSAIYNTLIQYPNCAISMQIIPTIYNNNEKEFLAQSVHGLKLLSNGIMDKSIGATIQYKTVDTYLENYEYFLNNSEGILFKYACTIYGQENQINDISNKLYSHLSNPGFNDINIESLNIHDLNNSNRFILSPWIYNDSLNEYYESHYTSYPDYFRNLTNTITLNEACQFFRLPLGNEKLNAGLPIIEAQSTKKTYTKGILNTDNLMIGHLNNQTKDRLGMNLNDLSKHMLVCGMPGSGKTNFLVGLLDRLWNEYHLPFLVIEPAKSEYRGLIDKIKDIQIFSVGKNQVSPFVFNPFLPPKNVRLESYKSTLKTAFSAAINMESPLDHIFEETIHNCYADHEWLDSYTIHDGGKIFNIQDFINCFKETFNSIGYTGDAKNIGRAGEVRLNSLVHLFDTYNSIPVEDILNKPTIIELNGIENSEQKSLIIALLLLSILSYVNANYKGDGTLKNILLLEEAHILLDANEQVNSNKIAQELLKRILAEMRSYGLGVIIADQSPRKVSEDVVSLTDIKLAFRLVETKDKQIIADSINLDEAKMNRFTRLRPGQAYFYFNKLDEPEELVIPHYRFDNNIRLFIHDNEIHERMNYWKIHQDKLKPYPECHLCNKCIYEKKLLAQHIARKIFNKYFTKNTNDIERLKKIIPYINQLILQELKEETKDYLLCTKIHLYRRIKNETKIKITDKLLYQLLTK